MIIFGNASKTVPVRQTGTKRCPTCNADRPHTLVLQYDYFHIYWAFGHVNKKTYRDACNVCQRGLELSGPEVEKTLPQSPIPPLERFGLWIFLGGLLFLLMMLMMTTRGCR